MWAPISSTNTTSRASRSPATSTHQAARKNSSRSAAFTPLFAGVLHPLKLAADRRVAHRDAGERLQILAPVREGGKGRSFTSAARSLLACSLSLGFEPGLFFGARDSPSLAAPAYLLTDRGERDPEGAGSLALAHAASKHRSHDLLSEVLRVCVHPPLMPDGSVTSQLAVDHLALRLLAHIRDFFVRSGLSFYCFLDSSSHDSQKSPPNYIYNYAAYETCGQQ